MSAPFAYDVFLSHNSKDKPRVRKLAERLRAEGLRVWFDDWVIRAVVQCRRVHDDERPYRRANAGAHR